MLVVEVVARFLPAKASKKVISARLISVPKSERGHLEFFCHIGNVANRAVFLHSVHKRNFNVKVVLVKSIVDAYRAVVPFIIKSVNARDSHNLAGCAEFRFCKERNARHLTDPAAENLIAKLLVRKRAVELVYKGRAGQGLIGFLRCSSCVSSVGCICSFCCA